MRELCSSERLLGCCDVPGFGQALVVDCTDDPPGWVSIVLKDGTRWFTRDGVVFHSHGRAVRVGRDRHGRELTVAAERGAVLARTG